MSRKKGLLMTMALGVAVLLMPRAAGAAEVVDSFCIFNGVQGGQIIYTAVTGSVGGFTFGVPLPNPADMLKYAQGYCWSFDKNSPLCKDDLVLEVQFHVGEATQTSKGTISLKDPGTYYTKDGLMGKKKCTTVPLQRSAPAPPQPVNPTKVTQ